MVVPVLVAFLLTLVAGGATSIGAALGVLGRGTPARTLAGGLGLSAGVMLYVSFMELLPEGAAALSDSADGSPTGRGSALAVAAFFGGIALIALLDRLVPEPVNPHEFSGRVDHADVHGPSREPAEQAADRALRARLLRTGTVMAMVLALHNVPEGFATFVAALQAPEIAIPVVAAIALHNIPEGLAVAVPVHRATGSRAKAFWLATMTGLAEPAGAVVGYLLLAPLLEGPAMGAVLAGVAGVMVFVSLDELLPAAEETGEHHTVIYSLIAGMALMAVTLIVL
ncbi:zinc transporter ZupT [Brachybacterium sp. p3-SID1565]|uniref:Zinc transporter ZupT n=1 Tax=Brachybacterium epidermidis TaxID=2781983 RepID=A0ABR9VXB7_9MICO|nr:MULTISPECIES: zinc transporter ZupT [Brachybacterium]MBE9402839.1 zinc transporter ZupT [Brachybacterium epidermidis]MCT1386020.1 zinc transporter ZupT [Brachybacterium sp. p3-SID1565]